MTITLFAVAVFLPGTRKKAVLLSKDIGVIVRIILAFYAPHAHYCYALTAAPR